MQHQENRILFVSLSNIGDVLMTTPVLTALHALHPQAVIDIVADRRSSEIFRHCPFRGDILHKDKGRPLRGMWSLLRQTRKRRYDVVVDLRTDVLLYLVHARRRFGKAGARHYGPHAVEKHMGVISELFGQRSLPRTQVWLSGREQEFAATRLAALGDGPLLCLGPGANWPPKRWPSRRFLQLARLLAADFAGVVLLGDADDRRCSREIAGNSPLPCIDLCGETDILQAAAVLQRARLFVGNDSGLGHLASAAGTMTVTVFGVGDAVQYHPWGPEASYVTEATAELAALPAAMVYEHINTRLRQKGWHRETAMTEADGR